jgi:hypothetical protein
MIRYCPNCSKKTQQKPTSYNPDNPSEGECWQCQECYELTGWIEEFKEEDNPKEWQRGYFGYASGYMATKLKEQK